MAKMDASRFVEKVQDEIKLIFFALKEKGGSRFGRTLLIALSLPLGCYCLVDKPAEKRLSLVDGKLRAARSAAKHADTYKDLKNRIEIASSQLPGPKDHTSFLSDTVREALRAENIVATTFQPPNEVEVPGGVVQSLSITMRVTFPELMAFLARMESNKPLIQVNNVILNKRSEPIGVNEVTCGLSTIFLLERF